MFPDSRPWLCLEALYPPENLSSKLQRSRGEEPTSLQVQTKVEERSVSKRTQQVVAAFKGGH